MKNIKVSKTFAALIIIIVASVFLLPNLISSVKLYFLDKDYNEQATNYKADIAARADKINQSLSQLRIKDSNLYRCIESEVSRYKDIPSTSSGAINSVVELRSLPCSGQKIATLEGIQDLYNLESIDLRNNKITDISYLTELHSLKTLYINGNTLVDNRVILNIPSLEKASLPDFSKMMCADILDLINSAKFRIINRKQYPFDCI